MFQSVNFEELFKEVFVVGVDVRQLKQVLLHWVLDVKDIGHTALSFKEYGRQFNVDPCKQILSGKMIVIYLIYYYWYY